ncbi:MAG: hypothetical protein QXY79_04120, partial [Candidatus Methanomethylicia archaeon]|nr:hypothetical protein [Candidatus Brockarchaeota archaeon]
MKGKEENQLPPDFDPNRRKFLKLLFFISTLPLSGCVANIDTTNGEGRDVGEREKEGERWRVVRSVYVYPFSGKREAWQKPPPSIDLGSLVLESDIRKAMRDIFKFLFETEYGWKSSFSSSKLYEQFSDGKHPQEVFRSLERIFTSGASSEEGLPFWTRIEFIRGGFSSIDENTFNKLMQQIINEGLSNQESRFRLVGYIPDIKQSRYSNIPRLLLLVEDKDTKTLFFIKTISANDLRREIGALKILKEVFGEEAPIPTTCVFRLQRSPNNRLTIIITEALTSAEPLTNQNLRVASSFYSIMYGKRLFESLSELERKQIADAYFEIYKRWIESMVKASSQEGGGWVISPDAIAPRNVLLIKGETGYKTAVVDGAASRITGFRISFSDKWGITTNVDWINRGIRGLRGVLNDLGIDNTEILKVEKAIFEGSISSTILPDEVLVEPNSSFE